ncbi:ubl carboxyl-terminal hydrolase 18 isoform X2 [Rhinatrema bivittatum]|nr:ubl carboxyl-terminal hydrolase 18 isoform X2 [Rhinatrema bivittatum]
MMTEGERISGEGCKNDHSSEETELATNKYRHDAQENDKSSQWMYTSGDFKNGAIGLYNIGLTCCLNSLLQTFYMNRDFTNILQGITVPEGTVLEENVPYQLRRLFEQMQESREKAIHPYRFIRCLQINQIKLNIQHDAAELFFTLWNLIHSQIPQLRLAERLSTLYTIQVLEYVTCLQCSLERTRDSIMLTLPLSVSGSRFHRPEKLEDALRYFFQPEKRMEDNKCFCPQCEKETLSLQGIRLKSLPQILTLHIKRITSRNSPWAQKISCTLPFPKNLDLSEVLESECIHLKPEEQTDCLYKLFAVIAHSGTASFGHYCAYIRNFKDKKWYCFNDSSVCKVSWDDIKCTFGNFSFHWGETAYLLVYRKAESL